MCRPPPLSSLMSNTCSSPGCPQAFKKASLLLPTALVAYFKDPTQHTTLLSASTSSAPRALNYCQQAFFPTPCTHITSVYMCCVRDKVQYFWRQCVLFWCCFIYLWSTFLSWICMHTLYIYDESVILQVDLHALLSVLASFCYAGRVTDSLLVEILFL